MVSLGNGIDSSQIIATINIKSIKNGYDNKASSWFVTPRGPLVSVYGGVELLTSPLAMATTPNHR